MEKRNFLKVLLLKGAFLHKQIYDVLLDFGEETVGYSERYFDYPHHT